MKRIRRCMNLVPIVLLVLSPFIISSTNAFCQSNNVELVGSLDLLGDQPALEASPGVKSMMLDGNRLLVLVVGHEDAVPHNSIYVVDVSDPENPVRLDSSIVEFPYIGGDAFHTNFMMASLDRILTMTNGVIDSYDLSNPEEPVLDDSYVIAGGGEEKMVSADDYYALVGRGVKIFDAAKLPEIYPVGLDGMGTVGGAAFNNNYMVAGLRRSPLDDPGNYQVVNPTLAGIRIYKISNSALLSFMGALYTRKSILDLAIDDRLVFAIAGGEDYDIDDTEMQVFDISNPVYPELVGAYTPEDEANLILARDGLAYLINAAGKINILRYTGHQASLEQNAYALGHTIPQKIMAGQSIAATVTVRNCGQSTWMKSNYKMALINESCPLWQGVNFRALMADADLVTPGDEAVFPIELKAPDQPGNYLIELQMVEESVEFFGSKLNVVVEVIANSQTQQTSWTPYE